MNIYVPKEELEIYNTFFKLYEPYVYQGTLESNKREAKKSRKQKMKCRFCKETTPDTSFTQDTHILPHLLGNKNYYSDDECDKCNKIFGTFEDDLAKYLGLTRTFNKITSGSRAPKFESGNGHIGVKTYNNGIVEIEKKNLASTDFSFDKDSGKISIRMNTQAYIPANVYLAFLKMALAILPDEDVPDYAPAYDYLLNGDRNNQLEDHKFIKITESRVLLELPFALLFQKKKEYKNTCSPLHVFCIYVRNYMFQIIFPLSNEEMISANVDVNVNDAPYMLLNGQELDNVIMTRYRDELCSIEPQKRDSSIHMKFEDGALDNLVSYSKENGFQKVNLI